MSKGGSNDSQVADHCCHCSYRIRPSIGTGTAQAAVLVEVLAAAVFTGGMVAAFTARMVASIRVIMVMAIPRTATTATDQV